MNVDANNPSHPCLMPANVTGAAGDTTTTDPRSQRNRGSQRRPATNRGALLIVRIGLPAPSCSRCLCPGWSHHPRSRRRRPNLGTEIFIPVPNAVGSLHRSAWSAGKLPAGPDGLAHRRRPLAQRHEWTEAMSPFATVFADRSQVSALTRQGQSNTKDLTHPPSIARICGRPERGDPLQSSGRLLPVSLTDWRPCAY